MASAFREDRSHLEEDTPRASAHGAGALTGQTTANAAGAHQDDVSETDHVEEKVPAAAPLTKKQKLRRHCGRFKWWYVAGSIIFLAIFLPILFTVIIPAIVRGIVNDQTLPVYSGSFQALSPTQLMVSLNTSLDTPLAADLDAMTMFLYNHDNPDFSPFLNLTIPKVHVHHETEVLVTNQTATITNETELVRWFNNVFDQPKVALSVRGDTTVHLGALHYGAHLDKNLEVSSLNQLSGFGIQDLQLVLPTPADGKNIKGTLSLPNWGALSLGLGDLSLNLMSGDVRIGLITVYDVVLPPGNNTRDFDGAIFLNTLVSNLGAILAAQAEALADGNVQVDATGNATMLNGEHIPFIESILKDKRLTSYIPVTKLLSDVINSVAGSGNSSLLEVFSEVFGNGTFIEEVLSHWNTTGLNSTTAAAARTRRHAPRSHKSKLPAAFTLFKLGMKMAKL